MKFADVIIVFVLYWLLRLGNCISIRVCVHVYQVMNHGYTSSSCTFSTLHDRYLTRHEILCAVLESVKFLHLRLCMAFEMLMKLNICTFKATKLLGALSSIDYHTSLGTGTLIVGWEFVSRWAFNMSCSLVGLCRSFVCSRVCDDICKKQEWGLRKTNNLQNFRARIQYVGKSICSWICDENCKTEDEFLFLSFKRENLGTFVPSLICRG